MTFHPQEVVAMLTAFDTIMLREYPWEMASINRCEKNLRDPGLTYMMKGKSPLAAATLVASGLSPPGL